MTRRLSDRIAGAIFLALAAWYWWIASGFQENFGDPVGPATFPQLVAVPMALFATFLIARPDPDPKWIHMPGIVRQGLTLASLLIYPALIEPLGFPFSTFLGTAALVRILGGTWLNAVVVGLIVGIGLFAIFDSLLGLPLPLAPKIGR